MKTLTSHCAATGSEGLVTRTYRALRAEPPASTRAAQPPAPPWLQRMRARSVSRDAGMALAFAGSSPLLPSGTYALQADGSATLAPVQRCRWPHPLMAPRRQLKLPAILPRKMQPICQQNIGRKSRKTRRSRQAKTADKRAAWTLGMEGAQPGPERVRKLPGGLFW